MSLSAAKDSMMNLLANNYSYSASQTIIAQWNHNRYTEPSIYGYYPTSTTRTSPDSYYVSYPTASTAMFTTQSQQLICSPDVAFNTTMKSNIVRLMFDIKIDSITGTPIDASDFALVIKPYVSGTIVEEFSDTLPISIQENVYQKQEVFYCSNSKSLKYFDKLALYLYPTNNIGTASVSVTIKNLKIGYVNPIEMEEFQHDRLGWITDPIRPGDQLLENLLFNNTDSLITKYHIATDAFSDQISSPALIPTLIGPYNESIYYIPPKTNQAGTGTVSNIYIEYASPVVTNQIYIKTQDIDVNYGGTSLLYPNSSFEVFLKMNNVWSTTPIYTATVPSGAATPLLLKGSTILRFNGISSWSSDGLGYFAEDLSRLPIIDPVTGAFSLNTASIQGIKIEFNASRSRIIEISPRLAVNLSNFLVSSNTSMNIDEGNYPVPVGLASSNSGEITLENLPRYTGTETGPLYQIFDNNQYSPLNGLIKPDVKFTIYTTIIDNYDQYYTAPIIKNATMYASQWENEDIETVKIKLNDYAKTLQQTPAPDILMMSEYQPYRTGSIKQAVEALLQLSKFSDYDVNSLTKVSDKIFLKTGGQIPIFYSNKDQNVWEVLSDIFIGYQVSFYFDENGILQFKDILRESASGTFYSDTTNYFQLTSSVTTGYLPNIISSNINKKEDVGEISVKYKERSVTTSTFDINGKTLDKTAVNFNANLSIMESDRKAWEITNEPNALICVNVINTIGISDNTISTGDFSSSGSSGFGTGRAPRLITSFNGYGTIGGEIISWDGLEYEFTPYISGYNKTEIIKTPDELSQKVTTRVNALDDVKQIVRFTRSGTVGDLITASTSTSHSLLSGDIVSVGLFSTDNSQQYFSQNVIIKSVPSSDRFTFNVSTTLGAIKNSPTLVGTNSYVVRDISKISYRTTGKLMNVRRGLFGTNAAEHYSSNAKDDSAFYGIATNTSATGPTKMKKGMWLQQRFEPDNTTAYNLAVPANRTAYFGFHEKDSATFERYRFVFNPQDNLDGFGIFLGASARNTSGSITFISTDPNQGNGLFIEFFPSNRSGTYGALVRTSVDRSSDSNIIFYSLDKFLLDAFTPPTTASTYQQDSNHKDVIIDGKKVFTGVKVTNHPAKQQVITVLVDERRKNIKISVNNKQMKFIQKGQRAITSNMSNKITYLRSFKREDRTFGIFMRNDNSPTTMKIQEIQAAAKLQTMDREVTWYDQVGNRESYSDLDTIIDSNTGIPSRWGSSNNSLTGFKPPGRSFSLRAEPILRGIIIYDVKFNNNMPFFDLKVQSPYGKNVTQVVTEGAVHNSTIVASPFRGKVVYRNGMSEVVSLKTTGETYRGAMISGKSITESPEKTLTRTIKSNSGLSKIQITSPWSSNSGVAEKIINDISKNINEMNTMYNLEIFGNPALQIGDYVRLVYPEKNINRIVIISSIENTFSDGGFSTNVIARNVNVSN